MYRFFQLEYFTLNCDSSAPINKPKATDGAAPVRDPGFSIVTPGDGAGCNDPAPAAPQPTHRQVLPPA